MIIIKFIKNILADISFFFKRNYWLTKLRHQYPTCEFYRGIMVSNTTFERFNVVFNDVIIDSCNIGAHTYIQKKSTIFNAEIGRFCSIASGVSIGPGIHKTDGISTHPSFFLKDTPLVKTFVQEDIFVASKRTVIGNDVWIGERAIILDGITIGTGAIISAGAVVTKDVMPYSIVGGVPAKLIKFRFPESEINNLLKSEWWNKSEDWLEKNINFMSISM